MGNVYGDPETARPMPVLIYIKRPGVQWTSCTPLLHFPAEVNRKNILQNNKLCAITYLGVNMVKNLVSSLLSLPLPKIF